ncbi:zinc-binding alcohol dehydrogenase [Halolamina litorea]|uniref:Zinc-binding alcohol dehydrogenase n=1 Tax=Halolamina litorea TaxID=1515593 RepID=A0ABD6BXI5_9EURY|nr:zinc-binding alcohol dehydrogenase [Halolamina litorea]
MTDAARALYFQGPRSVTVSEEPRPSPDTDEVLLETVVSGVSPGTELLVYEGKVPEELAVDETIDTLEGTFDYPVQYGYAAVGRVMATGANVDDSWLDELAFAFNPHESHFTANPAALEPVPDGIDPETATLFPTAETAVNFVLDAAPRIGERVVVFGAGPIGLTTTALLSTFPLDSLTVVDPVADRRSLAESFGATATTTPEGLRGIDWGDPAGADCCVEVSGNPNALDDAIRTVGYDGRVVIGSWYGTKSAELDLGGRFHRERIDLRSSQVSTIAPADRGRWTKDRRMDRAVDAVREHDLGRLVTHRIPFGDASAAYELLASEDDALTTVFTYDDA